MLSTHFSAEVQEALNYKISEVQTIKDQLALLDVKIDRYDTIIQNIDKKIVPLIDEINVAVSSVKTAYDNLVSIGCSNNLYWEMTSKKCYDYYYDYGISEHCKTTYTCVKNPNLTSNPYYGVKYYRKPQNQDYGSNIVREFSGTISTGSTILAVLGIDGTSNLALGDFIVDNIDNPTVFYENNLPTIVGFGTTSVVNSTIDFEGSVSYGSTIIASIGVGSTGQINLGDTITLPTVLDQGTIIVGFGTTTITIDNVWDPGSGTFISTSAITSSLIVSIPATMTTGLGTFKVGPLQSYPGLFLSTSANIDATNSNFTDIRTTQVSYTTFDYTNNPIDPVTVGIIDNKTIGYGNSVVKVANGYPSGPYQWHQVMTSSFANKADGELNDGERYLRNTYPEPNCGAGNANYYPGDLSWPGIVNFTYNEMGQMISSSFTYANEGDKVIVSYGQTTNVGYAYSTKTITNPNCVSYGNSTFAAIQSRNAIIAKNEPQIDNLVASSTALRGLRDILESRAFSMLQGRINGDIEVNNLTQSLKIIQSTDYTQFEPTNYYYNVEEGKYNSSTIGVATN